MMDDDGTYAWSVRLTVLHIEEDEGKDHVQFAMEYPHGTPPRVLAYMLTRAGFETDQGGYALAVLENGDLTEDF